MLVGANVPPHAGLQPSPRRPRAAPVDRSTSSAPWPQTPPGARLQHCLHHRRLSGCSGRGDVDGGTRGDGQGGQWSTDRELCVPCFGHCDQSGCV